MSNKNDKEIEMHKCQETTEKIIKAFYNVYHAQVFKFLEKVYENAWMIELIRAGLGAVRQQKIDVYYEGEIGGKSVADF